MTDNEQDMSTDEVRQTIERLQKEMEAALREAKAHEDRANDLLDETREWFDVLAELEAPEPVTLDVPAGEEPLEVRAMYTHGQRRVRVIEGDFAIAPLATLVPALCVTMLRTGGFLAESEMLARRGWP